MILPTRRPLPALVQWCRAIKHGLYVGLPLPKVFKQQAKSGPPALRDTARKIAELVEDGESLTAAMNACRDRFPPLMLELVNVGEQGGRLTEIFGELEQYFETVIDARRTFQKGMILPCILYFGAMLVMTVGSFVLGMIGYDPLGWGLVGFRGAFTILFFGLSFAAFLVIIYEVVRESDDLRAGIEATVLPVPILGGCVRGFALHRFLLSYHVTSEAGMRADKCLAMSLRATTNRSFAVHADWAGKRAKRGEPVWEILSGCGANTFPHELIESIRMAEEVGKLPDVVKKQAEIYAKEAARQAKVFVYLISGIAYAIMLITLSVLVVQGVRKLYIEPINNLADIVDRGTILQEDPFAPKR
jgi:type IV pilus assembly protein PilC